MLEPKLCATLPPMLPDLGHEMTFDSDHICIFAPWVPKSQPRGAWETGAHSVRVLNSYDYKDIGTFLAVPSMGSWWSPEAKCLSCEQGFGGLAKSSILGLSSLSIVLPLAKQPILPTCSFNFERD